MKERNNASTVNRMNQKKTSPNGHPVQCQKTPSKHIQLCQSNIRTHWHSITFPKHIQRPRIKKKRSRDDDNEKDDANKRMESEIMDARDATTPLHKMTHEEQADHKSTGENEHKAEENEHKAPYCNVRRKTMKRKKHVNNNMQDLTKTALTTTHRILQRPC